jgi:phosphoribosylformylglycinamidine synthase subunit PurSL
MHRIEISLKKHVPDARGLGLVGDIADLGIKSVSTALVRDVYYLDAKLTAKQLDLIGRELLADPVTQEYGIDSISSEAKKAGAHVIEVAYKAGVVDPVEETVLIGLRDLNIKGVKAVKTAKLYILEGKLTAKQLDNISSKLLVNPIIHHVITSGESVFSANPQYRFALKEIDLMGNEKAAMEEMRLGYTFSDIERNAVRDYYKKLGRNPTDVELETLTQTWSEHCVHKTFKAKISYDGKTVNNIMKSTIARVTKELDKPWCLSVFVDNSGVIDFDGKWALCFKVETHNHPSAVEPYGGAATGIGGVIRDPLGTGLGAKPILNTDVFCFAPPDFPYEKLPKGVLHPRRIFKGVRAGVADYGNRLGIPTVNGAILFDERYLANPLVYCGTMGLMPVSMAKKRKHKSGDLIVLIGGKTGRDGIHGATFASEQLTDESGAVSYTSVQIGNPIVEKKVIDILLQARDRGLYSRITDCGAGGLSSAVGEMGEETGARVDLDKVPLKYSGLNYAEIWISEAQERMVIAVPPEKIGELLALCQSEDVQTTVIGEFTNAKKLNLFYKDHRVADLDMKFLHEGIPQWQLKAVLNQTQYPEPDFKQPNDLGKSLKDILGAWNVCSKEWVIRQYDHEVQGGTVIKPLVGITNEGPGDATVIKPVFDSDKGVIVANGINPKYGQISPYWMAAAAIDEALRQIVAVGGNLKQVALLDNFCWGDTRKPEMLGALVEAAQACYDMAKVYETPFVSGKDSLYNEFEYEGKIIAIPHTLLISAMGIVEDVKRSVSMDFKQAGDLIYVVGETKNEMGGSAYLDTKGFVGNSVPKVEPVKAKKLMEKLSQASEKGLVKACHDCSEGGIGVAVAEMAFAGGLGAEIKMKSIPVNEKIGRDDFILFSESNSRFIVEVAPENKDKFEKTLKGVSFANIGTTNETGKLEVFGLTGKRVVSELISDLKEAWQKPLRW